MKKTFDRFSKRGVIITLVSVAGLVFEILLKKQPEPFLVIMYASIAALGVAHVGAVSKAMLSYRRFFGRYLFRG